MSGQQQDPVDVFLDDLGSAPVPPGLAADVVSRLQTERPGRRSHWWPAAGALAAAGAILLVVSAAWIAGSNPAPTDTPAASAEPTPASPSPSAVATTSPAPSQTPEGEAPEIYGNWQLRLGADVETGSFELFAFDEAGGIVDVVEAPANGEVPDGASAIAIAQGSDERTLRLAWVTFACDKRGWLTLEPDGRTFTLELAPRPSCDAMGVGWAVDVRFDRPVDPSDFTGAITSTRILPTDVRPGPMAWFGPLEGFVGGRAPTDDAVVLMTSDGGATWRVTGLGLGEVSALGVVSGTPGHVYAGRSCPEGLEGCTPGLLVYDEGMWTQIGKDWPVSLSFADDRTGAGLFKRSVNRPPELRLTDDGGDAWTTNGARCPDDAFVPRSVTRPNGDTIVMLCVSVEGEVEVPSLVLRSDDGGVTWSTLPGPLVGLDAALDLRPDGTGWLWSRGRPWLETADGGRTWTSPVARSTAVLAADVLGPAGGFVVARDNDDDFLWRLLYTPDGATWEERFLFEQPCCGG